MWSNLQDQSSQNGRSIVVSCKPIPMPIARNKISNICMLAMNVGNRSKFDLKWWVQNVGFEIDFTCWMWIWLRMLGVHLNICWMQILIKNIVWFSKFKILNSWASIGFCWIFQVYPYSCIGEFDWEGGGEVKILRFIWISRMREIPIAIWFHFFWFIIFLEVDVQLLPKNIVHGYCKGDKVLYMFVVDRDGN